MLLLFYALWFSGLAVSIPSCDTPDTHTYTKRALQLNETKLLARGESQSPIGPAIDQLADSLGRSLRGSIGTSRISPSRDSSENNNDHRTSNVSNSQRASNRANIATGGPEQASEARHTINWPTRMPPTITQRGRSPTRRPDRTMASNQPWRNEPQLRVSQRSPSHSPSISPSSPRDQQRHEEASQRRSRSPSRSSSPDSGKHPMNELRIKLVGPASMQVWKGDHQAHAVHYVASGRNTYKSYCSKERLYTEVELHKPSREQVVACAEISVMGRKVHGIVDQVTYRQAATKARKYPALRAHIESYGVHGRMYTATGDPRQADKAQMILDEKYANPDSRAALMLSAKGYGRVEAGTETHWERFQPRVPGKPVGHLPGPHDRQIHGI